MLPRAARAAPGTRNNYVPISRRGVGDAPYSSFHISRCAYLIDNINPLYWIMDGFIITGHAGRRERADMYASLVLIASNPVERLRAKRGAAERVISGARDGVASVSSRRVDCGIRSMISACSCENWRFQHESNHYVDGDDFWYFRI